MSTKIYNGYQINLPNTKLLTLQQFCLTLSHQLNQEKTLLTAQNFARRLTFQLDRQTVKLSPPPEDGKSLISSLWAEVRENYKETSYWSKDPDFDFKVEVVFIPVKRKLLALYFGYNKKFLKIWEQHPLVKDYHYQNQTNRPQDISARQWLNRKKDWNLALPGPGIPSENGLTFILCSDHIRPPDFVDFAPYIPPLNERAQTCAREVVLNKKFQASTNSDPFPKYQEALKFLQTDAGLAQLEQTYQEVLAQLIPHISKDDFYNSCK